MKVRNSQKSGWWGHMGPKNWCPNGAHTFLQHKSVEILWDKNLWVRRARCWVKQQGPKWDAKIRGVCYKSKMGLVFFRGQLVRPISTQKRRVYFDHKCTKSIWIFVLVVSVLLEKTVGPKGKWPKSSSLMAVVFLYLRINPHSFPSLFTKCGKSPPFPHPVSLGFSTLSTH